MATEWTTLLDWQPDPVIHAREWATQESPMDLSPALTAADDDRELLVDVQVQPTASFNARDRETWAAFPTIRAGDYRVAPAPTNVGHATSTWGVAGSLVDLNGRVEVAMFTKGTSGRPAYMALLNDTYLKRMRVRMVSYVPAVPAPSSGASPAAAAESPAPAVARPYRSGLGRLVVSDDPIQRILTQIEGVPTTIHLRWDDLSGYWYLGLAQGSRQVIAGRRVIPGIRLLPPAFGWQLVAAPLSDAVVSVGRNAWGQTHALLYVGGGEEISWLR